MRTFGIPIPLFDKAGEGSGGGGGGDGSKAEGKLTEEQRAEIGSLISGALKSEGKRQIAAAVKDALEGLKLGETIAAEVAKLKPEPTPEPKPGEKKADPEVTALKATVAELTKKLTAEAEERQKAVEAGRAKDAKAALRSVLTPLVRPDALDIAVRDLFDAQKLVTLDESGNPLIKVRRKDYAGADEEVDMPLADGVTHWIKTQDGKFYAPPPSGGDPRARGAPGPRSIARGPDGMPRYDQPATTDDEKIRRAQEREEVLKQKYPHLT